jgi:hypothetical protein
LVASRAEATLSVDLRWGAEGGAASWFGHSGPYAAAYTDDSLTTPVADLQVSPDGNRASWTLAPGQVIVLSVHVANPDRHAVQALFTSVFIDRYQGQPVQFIGGTSTSSGLLMDEEGHSLPLTGAIGPKSAVPGDVLWVQGTAHARLEGATGPGPDQASLLLFAIGAPYGDQPLVWPEVEIGLTDGDVISEPSSHGAFPHPVVFDGIEYVPEPSMALLLGLGLGGLGAARPRDRANRERRES